MDDIQFFHTPMQRELLIAKIRANPSLKEIFKKKKNITQQINEEIKHRTDGTIESWMILYLKGSTGSLKSSVAMTLLQKFIDPTFHAQRISFQYDKLKEKLSKSQPKQAFQLDEQTFTHGIGSTRIIQDLQNLIETLRKRQNSMIIISPELKYFPEESFTFVLETIDDSITATCPYNKKPHEPRKCKCWLERNNEISHAYARLAVKKNDYYLGFYIIKIDWNNDLWTEYSKAKQEFLEAMAKNDLHQHNYRGIAEKLMKHPEYEYYKRNKKSLALLIEKEHPNLTTMESALIAEEIKVLQRIEEANL